MRDEKNTVDGIAIVGMAGRFPGARSVEEFWRNQLNGVESISHFELKDLDIPNTPELASDPTYVRARSVLDDVDLFDADFFGMHPREAELTDPQHRLFLECCWQALEDAGHDPAAYAGGIGVYAGCSPSTYFLSQVCAQPGFIEKFTREYHVGNYQEMLGSNVDFLSTRVSYKLNLRGPSLTMQAGCSTSLLAVTQACQSLLTYQNDMALAGGSSITFPQKRGSRYQDGGMTSPDGHCRAFDAKAQGTVFGSGTAVVLLKRLEDAMRDADHVYAVIKGFAANNDGAAKVGYTAPSVEGQARVIAMAQAAAGVNPETIGYLEAHGTATPLGDPIELAAASRAFRAHTNAKGFCAIGTAKTNVGHLDIASGVTGLIHATQIVRHGIFPATLHFQKPNPKFDLDNSPFYVNKQRTEWKAGEGPRRAGVSSFGVGGTNAHVVIEQGPEQPSRQRARAIELFALSARSEAALERATDNLAEHLRNHPEADVEDVAWTLQAGRRSFPHRRALVARDANEAVAALTARDRDHVQTRSRPLANPEISFLFPGQGSQHPNMGRELYETELVFREAVDRCSEILRPSLGADLKQLLYPDRAASGEAAKRITETILAQPAIFTVEYALAQLWVSLGIRPKSMLGHSVGEFVAACLAGVFSLEDGLRLVAARGEMMQKLPAGGMLSVRLPEGEIRSRINGRLSIAAVNSPSLCVVSGPFEALEPFENQLQKEGVASRRLVTSHAFHSAMMDPIAQPFSQACARVRLSPPRIPYVSGVTGKWITSEQATDPAYWGRHFREPVQFSAGLKLLRENPGAVLLEVGPGNVLTTLARQHTGSSPEQVIVPSLADGHSGAADSIALMNALGALWMAGAQPNWPALYHGVQRRRVSLPTYPFERKRYWTGVTKVKDHTNQVLNSQPAESPVSVAALVPQKSSQENDKVQAQSTNSNNRVAQVTKSIVDIFEDLSGTDISSVDGTTTFLEMGFDSLFLTQVTQALQSKFGLKITFRQLLGDQSSLNGLVEYVDKNVSAETFLRPASVAPPTAVSPGSTPSVGALSVAVSSQATNAIAASASTITAGRSSNASVPDGAIERVMREQMQAMNDLFAKQLEALRGVPDQPRAATSVPAIELAAKREAATAPQSNAGPMPIAATPAPDDKDTKELKGYTPFKPLQKESSAELKPQQRDYIASLVERYTRRTAESKKKTQEYRQALADPRVVSGFRSEWKEMVYPIIAVRSKGSHLWDVDGNEYVDLLNGFGPIMLGHRPDFVEKAIEKQLHEGFEIGPQTLLAGEVAKMICEFTGNERATFCNTGSEAVVAAMRVARTVTGRNKIVFFAGDYHGMFDEVLVKGIRKGGVPHAIPVAPGIPREKAANVVMLEYGSAESLEWIRANANDLAAVMVEPVQSRHPALQPVEFLRELRKITEESGAPLIFDEVVTGFRVHPGGCQALFDIRADLATYGKVLAGGMPIGVLAGKAHYMDALDGGAWQFGDDSYPETGVTFFAGTFVRHPLTLAAAKAVLEHLKEEGPALQERLSKRTAELVQQLNGILAKHNVPTHIENFASIFYFSFPTDFRFGSLFYYQLREKGIHLLEGFPCFLTTAHSEADLERVARAFEESVAEMQAGGALPVEKQKHAAASASQIRHVPVVETKPVYSASMTEPQLEIWLSDQLSEDASCSYNESFTLGMRGALNQSALQQAILHVIARHDALRSSFDGEAHRVRFDPELKIEVPVVDLTSVGESERDARVHQIIQLDARTPFRLAEGPLVRAQLVLLEPEHTLLIFTSHHIVCDGWSTNVLLGEISTIYNALVHGGTYDLPRAVSFGEYATTQAAFAESDEGKKIEKFWVEQFQELPPLLDLPSDHPRPSVRTYAGATVRGHIDCDLHRQIKQMGSKHGCTLFVTLLAGFQTLLHRLSNQHDIVAGIPAAGQSLLENSNLVGHCVNFLPVRARFSTETSFSNLLKDIRKTLFDAQDHQSYTYGTLVRKLAVPRSPNRLPLTEVQFNLERIGSGAQFDGVRAEVDPNPKSAVNFDLFFNVIESDAGLTIDCDYNIDLFDEQTIERWIGHYKTLLAAAAHMPDTAVDDLPLMTPAEVSALVTAWNPHRTTFPGTSTIHSRFEEQAARLADSVAVRLGEQQLTYRQLNERANQLARTLREKGVRPDSLVAVCFERSINMIVALLAVLKAGGAYVPIDSSYPKARLEMMFDDASPSVVLTEASLAANLSSGVREVICVDRDWPKIESESCANLEPVATPANLAYMIYTSGSTGRPKGVTVTHANFVRLLSATRRWFEFSEADVWSLFHTYSFDVSVWEMWGCLLTGGRLVIVPYWVSRSPQEFHTLLSTERVTVLCQTPVAFYQLIETEKAGATPLATLRYVILAGEALNFGRLKPWLDCHGDATPQIVNMYGPTEATVYSTFRRLTAADIYHETRSLIGVPVTDANIYILDAKKRPVPPGVAGELYIAGGGVARGYLNQPALTSERFVPDPFVTETGARMYRSGDLARFLPTGDVDFLGRLDDQVKIHGFRIELGEIEAVLAQHRKIAETAVMARNDAGEDKKLVAYFVSRSGEKIAGSELREFLQTRLPAHMLPYAYLQMDAMPLNRSGKVDRAKLPAPDSSAAARTQRYVAPRTPEEIILTDILSEVLKIERVGITDNLFELGADSLHVFQITSRAAKAGLVISPKLLLQKRTVEAVVAELSKEDITVPPVSTIKRVARDKYRLVREVEAAGSKG
ncbi:MAG TPA: amino acid adenylation domain-containing protein [Candidatus Acidoferrum sp.]|nr:amino acid adenylation domain-containing protein [Candidatus Acidoferrum sp.]